MDRYHLSLEVFYFEAVMFLTSLKLTVLGGASDYTLNKIDVFIKSKRSRHKLQQTARPSAAAVSQWRRSAHSGPTGAQKHTPTDIHTTTGEGRVNDSG